MDKALAQWFRVCLLGGVLFLGACSSTTFVYNRLDFLVPWYVDDYVDLNQQQKQHLDGLLEPFLVWHRARELPDYLKILDGIEDNLNQPQTPAMVAAVFNDFEMVLRYGPSDFLVPVIFYAKHAIRQSFFSSYPMQDIVRPMLLCWLLCRTM